MTGLVKYEAARRMLAEAVAVDEVLGIRNQAEAMRAYARQAKDRDLEIQAAQIRFRAERRLGEIIKAQKETVGLNRGRAGAGRPALGDSASEPPKIDERPTLEQAGIDKKLSSRAQRMAEIPAEKFEQLLERHATEVLEQNNKVSVDLLRTSAEADGRESRRRLAQVLSDASVELPTGRKFPCVYADPPWHRKQGVTNRSYENHYPTMSWDEICAMPVAELLLPDAWVFLWIPRAHLLALHPVGIEFADDDGRVITRTVKMPLAWAVARAWGCDSYSTCYIWTKTDEDHPDDQGGGVLVFDQDEILLQFKRGRGLPKPATSEKFKSNHRERKREHSRKPDHYRDMIRSMTGGVPVLELFARVDAEHPLPPDWEASGNQAQGESLVADATDAAPAPSSARNIEEKTDDGRSAQYLHDETAGPGCRDESIGGSRDRNAGVAKQDRAGPSRQPAPAPGISSAAAQTEPAVCIDHVEDPVDPAQISEFVALKAISDFCCPDRIAIATAIAADYIARGLAFRVGRDDWSLSEAGWQRFRQLDAERRAALPPPPAGDPLELPAFLRRVPPPQAEMDLTRRDRAPAEIVDGLLQTRLPLTEDELELHAALTLVADGGNVEWSSIRNLVGAGFVHANHRAPGHHR